jgi:uncharacterized protein YqgC (DUF456 family)
MAFGTFGAFLPLVPGPALVWFSAMIYALATNFSSVGVLPIIILTLLMILGSTTNLWMSALGVKAVGGSVWGILGGFAGTIVGMIAVTTAIAVPAAYAATRVTALRRYLVLASGAASVIAGTLIAVQLAGNGLFSASPVWVPR